MGRPPSRSELYWFLLGIEIRLESSAPDQANQHEDHHNSKYDPR